MGNLINLAGKRFGRLRVIRRSGSNINRSVMWECKCDCGVTKVISGAAIRAGITISCGCFHKEQLAKANLKHGLSKDRIFKIWNAVQQRCKNPKNQAYRHYGGRGIVVCEEWDNPVIFRMWAINNGYRDHLSIERINVNGNYEPSNCTWIPRNEQQKNTRKTNNNKYAYAI